MFDFYQRKQMKTIQDYIDMQRAFYNQKAPSRDIVGYYDWHENYPYETFLLFRYGDIRLPIFSDVKSRKSLDFACGPGRMVKRMANFFGQSDGCDISQKFIEEARAAVPSSNFYLTNGNDLGDVPRNNYDFIFCTISMHHICCYDVRKNILINMLDALNKEGKITLQMLYNRNLPKGENRPSNIANYFSNDTHAGSTNGAHDVGIGEQDLPDIKKDFENIGYKNVEFWFSPARSYFSNLRGHGHCDCWADEWIYIHGTKY